MLTDPVGKLDSDFVEHDVAFRKAAAPSCTWREMSRMVSLPVSRFIMLKYLATANTRAMAAETAARVKMELFVMVWGARWGLRQACGAPAVQLRSPKGIRDSFLRDTGPNRVLTAQ